MGRDAIVNEEKDIFYLHPELSVEEIEENIKKADAESKSLTEWPKS